MKTSAIKKLATCNGICYWIQVWSMLLLSIALQGSVIYRIAFRAIEQYLHKDLMGMYSSIYSLTANDCISLVFGFVLMMVGVVLAVIKTSSN
jgi:hypothetical protein